MQFRQDNIDVPSTISLSFLVQGVSQEAGGEEEAALEDQKSLRRPATNDQWGRLQTII